MASESNLENGNSEMGPITREILENALKKEGIHGDHSLVSFSAKLGTKPGDNYLSVIYSVELELKPPANDAKSFKRYWLIKCYPGHPGRQEFMNRSNMFFKELEIYSKWIPELTRFQKEVINLPKSDIIKLPFAHFVHGECIDFQSKEGLERVKKGLTPMDNYIIMEDMRKTYGYQMTNRRVPMDNNHMKLSIKQLAIIHAVSWAYKQHVCPGKDVTKTFSCLKPNWTNEDVIMFNNVAKESLKPIYKVLNETLGEGNKYVKHVSDYEKHFDTILACYYGQESFLTLSKCRRVPFEKNAASDATPNEDPWNVICHGDFWSNNLLFTYDKSIKEPNELLLIDLQMFNDISLLFDLQYAICTGPDTALRKKEKNNWLQLYFDTFIECSKVLKTQPPPNFTFDELVRRFDRAKPFGFLVATSFFPVKLQEESISINLEEADKDADYGKMFSEVYDTGVPEAGSKLVTDFIIEMHEEGVI